MELLFLAGLCLHILKTEAVVGHWCYQSQKCEQPQCEGPAQWHQSYKDCTGDRQSPVNIVTRNVVYEKSLKALSFEGYDVKGSAQWDVQNNGHTVKVALDSSPKIGGGGLERKYKAVEFHFHWGVLAEQQVLSPGSEHSIDGEKYPMEFHIVHIREDASDVSEAKKSPDGLAVLAFFVEAGKENKNYETLLSKLKNIESKGGSAKVDPLPLSSLLPPEEDLERYYRYRGSLTTPDCYQGVIWTIFETPVQLSLKQLSQFAALHFDGKNSTPMMENFRPAQPLNGREVLWSGTSMALPRAQLLLLALALACTLSSLSH
ncbi:carbonic anhydrase 4 [Ammospiza nelsoni]|uniref:carbonic anhydrase 4 n=1 Tax=Ammospiza caudacuta TaxID=2857398 RepID=UPI0027393258|nr:carbonic anhydrase 4 [Ammospiza caudacuta]XP_059343180.1 carbonic anhydrase 4 [Ammospiza nelsoni]